MRMTLMIRTHALTLLGILLAASLDSLPSAAAPTPDPDIEEFRPIVQILAQARKNPALVGTGAEAVSRALGASTVEQLRNEGVTPLQLTRDPSLDAASLIVEGRSGERREFVLQGSILSVAQIGVSGNPARRKQLLMVSVGKILAPPAGARRAPEPVSPSVSRRLVSYISSFFEDKPICVCRFSYTEATSVIANQIEQRNPEVQTSCSGKDARCECSVVKSDVFSNSYHCVAQCGSSHENLLAKNTMNDVKALSPIGTILPPPRKALHGASARCP